jgi:hypothetical protein
MTLKGHAARDYGTSGQPGRPGAHSGIGFAEVADWWLGIRWLVGAVVAAAAMRMASFIVGNLMRMDFAPMRGVIEFNISPNCSAKPIIFIRVT